MEELEYMIAGFMKVGEMQPQTTAKGLLGRSKTFTVRHTHE